MRGDSQLVRYADDAVLSFESQNDAKRVMAVLPKRFEKYGLTLHPEKTRIVEFVRPDLRRTRVGSQVSARPGTFDFLGFTHFWGQSRRGMWIVYRRTARDRFRRSLKRIIEWCRRHRHDDLRAQQQTLTRMLRGHFGYFGIMGNSKALARFRHEVVRAWRKWLGRRSQRAYVDWEHMKRLLKRYPLPPPRLVHPRPIANP